MTSTQEHIKANIEKLVSLEKAKKHYDTLLAAQELTRKDLEEIASRLEKEAKDIENIENESITSLFYKVLGNKEQKIEKERQDYMMVALQYKDLSKSLELNEYELEVLRKKVTELDGVKQSLVELKIKRESEIINQNEPSKSALMAIHHEMDDHNKLKQEILEAHNAGKVAIDKVDKVLNHLKDAIKWGEWDQMTNTGYYDHMKHSALDAASNAAHQAQRALILFSDELSDIGYKQEDFGLNVASFGSFMDIFFDNLISDWIIQNKIKNVFSTVDSVKDKILRILNSVEADFDTNKSNLDDCMKRKDLVLSQ